MESAIQPERRRRIEELFHSALKLEESQWAGFLDQSCAGDEALRLKVLSLLAHHKEGAGFLEVPALEVAARDLTPTGPISESEIPAPLAGKTISHYRIIEKLGGGGMGVVYKAEDVKLRRHVALKFLAEQMASDRAAVERFEREAQAASALNHPGICTIYEFGEHDGQLFLAMELIEGCSLRAFRERDASMEFLTKLASQAVQALAAAHDAGIVHRDIKPENIMVRTDGYLKLVDFGLARFTDHSLESTAVTSPGTVVGTVRYMSPEQIRGEAVSSASDIFSLGIVLYEFAVGRHPFTANSSAETLSAILSETSPAPSRLNSEISPALDGLIQQMLQKDPKLRPTAAEICKALASATASPARILPVKLRPTRPGRERERAELWEAYRDVANGRGLIACLSGEPGIGKTTITELFLEELVSSGETCFAARGRCSERLAGSEAYLPLLEALDSLLQGRSQGAAIRTMKALAPAWYAQVAFAEAGGGTGRESPQPAQTVSQEQLKRQLGALLRELSRTAPVILFLDDLHWADTSTIDLLAYLATKFAELRLLVIVTYRPSDLRLTKHPFRSLKLDLEARCDCRETQVGFLTRQEIESYLASEFASAKFPTSFANQLHARTEGNPLFLVNLVSDLRDRQVIAEQDGHWILRVPLDSAELKLPASIRGMIERKREKLSEDDQRLLGVASVQGPEFDSAILAEVLGLDVAEVEEKLSVLEQVHAFVRSAGETDFPDRTVSSRYHFVHILYQNAFYNALLPSRRRTLSMAVARALERHSGSEAARLAGQLAVLYEAAREFAQSSHYFLLAAQNAARVSAHHEAAKLARRGLEQLKSLPEDAERMKRELSLQNALGYSLFLAKGYGVLEVEQTFRRAQDLARQTGQAEELFGILRGLCFYYGVRGQLSPWQDMAGQVLELAHQSGDPGLIILSYHLAGDLHLWLGDFAHSRDFLQKGIDLYRAERDRTLPERFGAYDLAVGCRMFLAHDLWYLGYPDQARTCAEEAVQWARELKHAYSLAASSGHCAWIHILRGEPAMAEELAQECFQVSSDHGFPFHIAHAKAFRGWALSEQGEVERGIAELQEGIEIYRATGSILEHPFMAMLLASALAKAGRFELALKAIDTALDGFDNTPLFCDAELARWRGQLLLMSGNNLEPAERCFRKALESARRQNAKSLELRAALSLSRAVAAQGRTVKARQVLAEIYSWFSEGFETLDLRSARTALESQT
jgi:serine/threonine protein kinase/tetratricopeptide (TPR) repeat protein